MQQSPLLAFTSHAFPQTPDEDEQTNPGIYGLALARWIAEQLRARHFSTGEVFAEDFGWLVPVEAHPQPVHVACASGESADEWQVFCFVERGLLAKVLGRDDGRESLERVYEALTTCLREAPEIRDLREDG
jgi:hypothetical protein